jgi:hypothetical protein
MRRGRDPHELMEELAVDGAWFDGVLKSLAAGSSRRGVVRALGSFGLSGLLAGRLGSFEAEAKKKGKGKGKKKKKPKCADGRRNGGESDIDCGGKCARCLNGKTCTGPEDCQTSFCADGACQSCSNSGECGGTVEAPCFCEPSALGTSACNSGGDPGPQFDSCDDCPANRNCLVAGTTVYCVRPCGSA